MYLFEIWASFGLAGSTENFLNLVKYSTFEGGFFSCFHEQKKCKISSPRDLYFRTVTALLVCLVALSLFSRVCVVCELQKKL